MKLPECIKYLLFLLYTFNIGLHSVFATDDKNENLVKPEIKEAKVFLNNAQLTSQAVVTLEAGQQKVVFTDLANGIDPNSIQVSAKGVMILGVKYRQDYVKTHEKPSEIHHLEDSVKFYQFHLANLMDFEQVMKKEEEMIVANQQIGGKQQPLDTDDLEYFSNFFRKRLLDIRFQIQKNLRDIQHTNEKLTKFINQINQFNSQQLSTGVIVVELSTKAKSTVTFELGYVVVNAGWSPLYDVKVKDSQGPVNIAYKARVFQNTGLPWNNIKISLSTTNPSLGAVKPELYPAYLNLFTNNRSKGNARMAPSPRMRDSDDMKIMYDKSAAAPMAEAMPVEATETSLAVNFNIAIPYTIPTGEDGQIVDIQNMELEATYKHFTVPKLSDAAYMVALVTNYDDKNLISGPANIYFENSYVGETIIDVNSTEDTLKLSLGRDNNVVVERKMLKEMKSRSFIGSNRKEVFAYEISIRNSKKNPISITVEDQIPVSQNEQIEVETEEKSGAEKNETTGQLTWNLEVKPADTKKVNFRYSVKYPKNMQISGLR